MFCQNCGNKCDDDSMFCDNCGAKLAPVSKQSSSKPVQPAPPQPAVPPQQMQPQQQYQQPMPPQPDKPLTHHQIVVAQAIQSGFPMGFYNFIIYVQLILGPICLVIQGIMYITGLIYSSYGGANVYEYYPEMKPVNIFIGIIYIALAILLVVARQYLYNFNSLSSLVYLLVMGATAFFNLLYAILIYFVFSITFITTQNIISCGVTLGFGALVYVYLSRRKQFFIY